MHARAAAGDASNICVQGSMNAQWLDEMERIGMWQNEAMAAVVFPSAETLPELRRLDAEQQRLLLIFNPQWQTTGQLVSDFGWGLGRPCRQGHMHW